jgi:hypothetical protein
MIESLPWWKRWLGRLDHELAELDRAGIPYEKDERAFHSGLLRLNVRPQLDGRQLDLLVVFPDLYPYFRFEVIAPNEQLPYHQHAVARTLCLLGRATDNWNKDFTVAYLLKEQLPKVFQSGQSTSREAVAAMEEHQAEPYSDFYPVDVLAPSMFLIDTEWQIDPGERSGFLRVGFSAPQLSEESTSIRGAVLEVQSNTGRPLAKLDQRLLDQYRMTNPYMFRWIRGDEPIAEFNTPKFLERVRSLDPGAANNQPKAFRKGSLQLWAYIFPEESAWRATEKSDGWTFVCQYIERRDVAIPGIVAGLRKKGRG